MGSRRQREPHADNKRLLALEKNLVPQRSHGGDLRVHLVYPNNYWVAMSNLGFQAVYALFAKQPGVVVERGFLPEDPYDPQVFEQKWRTFESSRLLGDCDVIALSLSFETDYPHLFRVLRNAGLLSGSAQERAQAADNSQFPRPLILVGGTSVTLNPEPVADFVDAIFLGEAEEFVSEFVASVRQSRTDQFSRTQTLGALSKLQGVYVPQFFTPHYKDDDTVQSFEVLSPPELNLPQQEISTALTPISTNNGSSPRPERRFVKDLSKFPTYTQVLTPETEFRSMFLTETGRGCEMGCRFCVAGYIYRPIRKRSEESIADTIKIGVENSQAVGFVGASVSSHKSIAKLASAVAQTGARASLSSLMSQKVTRELAASLSESEYKTVALAPEAGTVRLRRAAGKRVSNDQVIEAAKQLADAGIRGFKLYFIVGLPTETDEDVDAIAHLAIKVRDTVLEASRESGKAAWVVLSVNPFIPKAATPFQWEPMLDREVLEKKIERISQLIKRVPNVQLNSESPKESYFQALLSRGDRRVGRYLELAENQGKDWKWLLSQAQKQKLPNVPGLDFYVTRHIPFDEILPWDIVDNLIDKKLLQRENMRAHEGSDAKDELDAPTHSLLESSVLNEASL